MNQETSKGGKKEMSTISKQARLLALICIVAIPTLSAATQTKKVDTFEQRDRNRDRRLVGDEVPERTRSRFDNMGVHGNGFVVREEQRKPANRNRQRKRAPSLTPTHANLHYGPHKRNVLDLYLVESAEPTPLVLYIHGGGFRGGDKRSLNVSEAKSYLNAGFSIAAINYRLTDTAPAPAAYLDCARALQFLRHNAEKWNIDPQSVASTGGSAGAGTSMWLAFHNDLANPNSGDPIARQSTRLTCIAVRNGQSSYDPRFAEKIGIPRPNFERHPFFLPFYGIKVDEIDSPRAYELYKRAAPITYISEDDPPALLMYRYPNKEVTEETPLGLIVHHPRFGIALKEQLDNLGIECIVQYQDPKSGKVVRHEENAVPVTPVEFIRRQFNRAKAKRAEQQR